LGAGFAAGFLVAGLADFAVGMVQTQNNRSTRCAQSTTGPHVCATKFYVRERSAGKWMGEHLVCSPCGGAAGVIGVTRGLVRRCCCRSCQKRASEYSFSAQAQELLQPLVQRLVALQGCEGPGSGPR
jgi:hypothetical protein